ncbi:MAG TPA: lysophospholipid acyltransferase family protein, partial [bacterium]|nr:lysophospholipid acyltransferase family protein [bacterium]
MDYIQYLLLRAMVWAVGLIPAGALRPVSQAAGTLMWHADPWHRRTIVNNLERALGGEKSAEERMRIGKAVFDNLIYNICLFLRIGRYSFEQIQEMTEGENLDYVDRVMEKGKGLIFVTAHFGNWEYLGIMGSIVLRRYRPVSIGRELRNRYVDRYIHALREHTNNRLIAKKNAVFEIMRTLKGNGIVSFLADQIGGNDSVMADFFGVKVPTVSSPAYFAARTGAPVVPTFIVQKGERYTVVFEKPIAPDLSKPVDEEVSRITQAYTAVIERYVRAYPDQWFWMHKRWKSKRAKKKFSDSYRIAVHAPNWIGACT